MTTQELFHLIGNYGLPLVVCVIIVVVTVLYLRTVAMPTWRAKAAAAIAREQDEAAADRVARDLDLEQRRSMLHAAHEAQTATRELATKTIAAVEALRLAHQASAQESSELIRWHREWDARAKAIVTAMRTRGVPISDSFIGELEQIIGGKGS